jgi:glycosyltransferase involved in cell wall biosynthesis
MRILFVSHNLKGNDGWSRYARDLISGVQKEGVEVLCLVNEVVNDISIPQKKCLGGPLEYVANPLRSATKSFFLNKEIHRFSPDIVHFIVEPYATMIPFLAKNKAKIVITAHSTFAFMPILVSGLRRVVSNYMTRLMYSKTDSVVCVSEYTKQHLFRHMSTINSLPMVEKKITILSGGIDFSEFSSPHEHNLSPISEILFVGAIKPRKGLVEAIEALALVKKNFIFRVVGTYRESDPYFILLKQKIKEYGLEKKIVFVGQVSDSELQKLYSKADLFLMLSTNNGADFEGYGLVYLEANAYGVPCIGPNDSGVSDAIVNGKTGYLVNQYDSPNVAGVIDDVLINHPIRSEDCVDWATENSKEKKSDKAVVLYNSLINLN